MFFPAPTAFLLPVKALVDKARAAGLISIVDGAHAPGTDGPALQQALLARYHIEIPVMEWGGQCYIRPSAQAYNVPADYEALVTGLRCLLPDTG